VRSTYGSGTSFWSDIGSYVFRGTAAGLPDGSPISVYYRVGTGSWRGLASGRTEGGEFAINKLVGSDGTFSFIATTGALRAVRTRWPATPSQSRSGTPGSC
jgi:hypothetical protein